MKPLYHSHEHYMLSPPIKSTPPVVGKKGRYSGGGLLGLRPGGDPTVQLYQYGGSGPGTGPLPVRHCRGQETPCASVTPGGEVKLTIGLVRCTGGSGPGTGPLPVRRRRGWGTPCASVTPGGAGPSGCPSGGPSGAAQRGARSRHQQRRGAGGQSGPAEGRAADAH
eukprot:765688-Prorocentrum_minimum.AAC.3